MNVETRNNHHHTSDVWYKSAASYSEVSGYSSNFTEPGAGGVVDDQCLQLALLIDTSIKR